MTRKNIREFRIYKPRQTNDGAASAWQLRIKPGKYGEEVFLFLTMAKQTGVDENGNAKFSWPDRENKTTIRTSAKIEEIDIGEFLTVLNGQKDSVGNAGKGLFHKNSKGNTIIQFSKSTNAAYPGFNLRISSKGNQDKEATSVQHSLTLSEAANLKVLLMAALVKKYGWLS